jgi:orotidine-5'-phosphate decarboxylase
VSAAITTNPFVLAQRRAREMNQSNLCVGLDPEPGNMPAHLAGVSGALTFCLSIIESTADLVCAYKPNLAFFERWGADGWSTLVQVIDAIPDHIPVIVDGKRGDIGNTSSAYAEALYGRLKASAVTANPYLGRDAIAPILDHADGFAFVLCRTSNPGAGDLQDLLVDGEPMYAQVIRLFKPDLESGKAGLVIGAKAGEAFQWAARLAPEAPILVPGIGLQGGTVEELGAAISSRQVATVVVSVSRSVIHASTGQDFAVAARRCANELRMSLQTELSIAMERGDDAGSG